jgi:hypothetical protein
MVKRQQGVFSEYKAFDVMARPAEIGATHSVIKHMEFPPRQFFFILSFSVKFLIVIIYVNEKVGLFCCRLLFEV